MKRAELLQSLAQKTLFDLAVVGGGATGLGVALDAALRGFSVVLLESPAMAAQRNFPDTPNARIRPSRMVGSPWLSSVGAMFLCSNSPLPFHQNINRLRPWGTIRTLVGLPGMRHTWGNSPLLVSRLPVKSNAYCSAIKI